MAIESVDMDRALTSQAYAQQVIRSGKVSTDQKGQIAARWGADVVNQWLSVDSTDYHIDDVSYDAAKQNGTDAAKDSTGYDGGKSYSSVGSAALAAGQAGAAGVEMAATGVTGTVNMSGQGSLGFSGVCMYVAAGLCITNAAKYWLENPNKEQVDAANHLKENELPESQASLNEAQGIMADASEEITELTEEAEEINDEANTKMEEEKTLFDFYKQQYEALKVKKQSGEQLTPDEKQLMKQLAPLMEDLGENITDTSEETSEQVNDINDDLGEYQEVFDESAETVAEVEGVTEFAEGFDENTRTMCYVEGGSQTLNAATGAWAAAKLMAGPWWQWALAIATGVAAASSGVAAGQQFSRASEVSQEIDLRRETQDLNGETNEIYEEELDNYAGNLDTVEDLELEVPEDTEVPSDAATLSTDSGNSNPFVAVRTGQDEQQGGFQSPLTSGTDSSQQSGANTRAGNVNQQAEQTDNNQDAKKKPEEEK